MRAFAGVDVFAERFTEAALVLGAIVRGDREGVGRFAGHAERSAGKLRSHVLTCLAGERQFEIVDSRRAIHGDGLDDAALDPVDQVGSTTGLDDVAADRDRNLAAFVVAANQMIAQPTQFVGCQLLWQRVDPIADAMCGRRRLAQVVDEDFARPRLQIVGFQTVQIERMHPCFL